jgi:hypothetical protein
MQYGTTGYTAEEIEELHKKGHHIGNTDRKLHAIEDDGAKKTAAKKDNTNAAGIVIDEEPKA